MVNDVNTPTLIVSNIAFVATWLVLAYIVAKPKLTSGMATCVTLFTTIGFWFAVSLFRGF
jgi:hypothetical protein